MPSINPKVLITYYIKNERGIGLAYFLLRICLTALSIAAAVKLVTGITFDGQWWYMLVVALLFSLVNALVKPVLALFALPLIVLTLGLFILVINALMLGFTAWLSGVFGLGLQVAGFCAALKGAFVISIANFLLTWAAGLREVRRRDSESDFTG